MRGPSGVTARLALELRDDAGSRRVVCRREDERATLVVVFADCAASLARESGYDKGRLTLRICSTAAGLMVVWYDARGRRFGRGGDASFSDAGGAWRLRAAADEAKIFVETGSDRVFSRSRGATSDCEAAETLEATGGASCREERPSDDFATGGRGCECDEAADPFLMSAKRKDGSLEELWLWRCECRFDEGPVMLAADEAASDLPGRLAAVEAAWP